MPKKFRLITSEEREEGEVIKSEQSVFNGRQDVLKMSRKFDRNAATFCKYKGLLITLVMDLFR